MNAQAVAIVVNVILFALVLFINACASNVDGPLNWLFGNLSTGEVSDKYYLEITPAGWAFSIWGLIYTWQLLWIIYSLSLICRKNVPEVLSPLFFLFYMLANVCNVSWIVLFSWEKIQICAFVLFATLFCLCATLAVSYWRMNKLHTDQFPKFDFWAIQILVNNGIALYATWCTVASLLNLAMAISYFHGVKQDVASTISLSILSVEIFVWFILENTVLERFLRYTVTIYPVLIWALSASIAKNFDPAKRNSIFTVVLLSAACALFFARIMHMIWRAKTRKVQRNKDLKLLESGRQ